MNLPELFEVYQNNVFPAMLDELAGSLNASPLTLTNLGVGFDPHAQAWVFAERDAKGQIIGLVQRFMDGSKRMVKGSKRGLSYPLNPNYHQGRKRFKPGNHHWVRVSEDVPCPICGKPDWCMVSSIDIYNPPAVLCARTESDRHFPGCGWLHILDAERNIKSSSNEIIPESKHPTIVVEGHSDVITAMELGFVAIGRPSAQGKPELVASLCRGKNVIVLGENDENGVGQKGMETCANKLYGVCSSVQKVLPPQGINDLRQWAALRDLTKEKFLNWVNKNADKSDNNDILESDHADYIMRQWIKNKWTVNGNIILCKYLNDYYAYENGKYVEIKTDVIESSIWTFLEGKKFIATKDIKPFKLTKSKIRDILSASSMLVPNIEEEPQWIGDNNGVQPDTHNLLCFKNGNLDITNREFYGPTSQLFVTQQIPYNFNPNLDSKLWYKFLDEVFDGDKEKIDLLQEWFGYVLFSSRMYEKFLLLTGVPRSGKSTILEVLTHLIGRHSCVATSFSQLAERFGLANLIGKKAVMIGDGRTGNRRTMDAALGNILQIVGNDPIAIDRKGKEIVTVQLPCAFTLAMNEFPAFSDFAKAIQSRALLIGFDISFAGREDFSLKSKLIKEADEGKLIKFALVGLNRLIKQNDFTKPESSKELAKEFDTLLSPLQSFISECCILDHPDYMCKETRLKGLYTPSGELFDAWFAWCKRFGYRPGKAVQFGRWLKAAYPTRIKHSRTTIDRDLAYVYRGIALTDAAKMKYLDYPGD